jgi:hypothetical protein
VEAHREVFGWVLGVLADRGLVKGKRIAIDATHKMQADSLVQLGRMAEKLKVPAKE